MTEQRTSRFLDPQTPPTMFTLVAYASLGATAMNIFLPSIPAIANHFQASYHAVQFLLSGFLLMYGVLQLIIGPISDRYGRRPVALGTVAIFVLASLACAIAPNTQILIAARLVQAVVVSSFVLSRAASRDIAGDRDAAAMLAYIAMGMSVVPMISPTLGGFLQEAFGWSAPFWTLTLMGTLLLLLIWRDMGETNLTPSTSMAQQMSNYPLLFKSRRFWGYALSNAFAVGCFFAFLGGAPYVGIEIFGLTPGTLGLYFMFGPAGYFIGSLITGQLSARLGIPFMMTLGSCITIFGLLLSVSLEYFGFSTPTLFFGCTIFIGIGNGMVLPSANAGMMSISPKLAGTAAGLGGALMTLGGGALSALVTPFLNPQTGAIALALFMLTSATIGLLTTLYALHIEQRLQLKN